MRIMLIYMLICVWLLYTTLCSLIFVPFLLRRAKKQPRGQWEEVELSAEAQRSGDGDPPRAPCSGIIPCIAMQGAGLRGRVGVVAKRRLGGERSGNKVLCRWVWGSQRGIRLLLIE